MRSSLVLAAVVFLSGASIFACSSATPGAASPSTTSGSSASPATPDASASTDPPDATRGELLWRGKCGACHTPVAPGSHDRAYFDAAMQRHRKRLHLEESDWGSLVEFLSKQPS